MKRPGFNRVKSFEIKIKNQAPLDLSDSENKLPNLPSTLNLPNAMFYDPILEEQQSPYSPNVAIDFSTAYKSGKH